MKIITLFISLLFSGNIFASQELAKKLNCMTCHATATKIIGPAFKDIASKYAGKKDAVSSLAQKVMKGSVGVWGTVPMPAQTQVNPEDATTLVKWVLTLK